jgi:epoxyqueuosine reductase
MDNSTLTDLVAPFGRAARIISIHHLDDLERNITGLRGGGLLAEEFNLEEFAGFNFKPPADLPDAHSIIVIAYPQFPIRFNFTRNGIQKSFLVPPGYIQQNKNDQLHAETILTHLEQHGWQMKYASLPKKLTAVCSGLGEYGRNNIVYVKGMGSFLRLVTYHSDMPCKEDEWREPVYMERCKDCRACRKACPTGAIGEDRFLLHAERCITWWNEKSSDVEFPGWIQPEWHNCLVGCMLCQFICPENKPYIDIFNEGPCFSEEETNWFLSGQPLEELPLKSQDKLNHAGLVDYYEPRNFRVLLER